MKKQAKSKDALTRELKRLRARVKRQDTAMARNKKTLSGLRAMIKKLRESLRQFKRSRGAVTEQQRMQALGQMASGVVHDFNNALTPILSASDYLLNNPAILQNEEQAGILLESIRTAARDARDMILQLREFYHTGKDVVLLPLDLNTLVKQVLSFTERQWKGGTQQTLGPIKIHKDLQDIPMILGNEGHIREMLTNLILNAIEAMPDGGTLSIRTAGKGRRAMLEIADTGKGMSKEIRERCFEPFFSTKGKKGLGMGLAMVYGIVHSHQGKISIKSKLGQGTAFVIQLPLAPKPRSSTTRANH